MASSAVLNLTTKVNGAFIVNIEGDGEGAEIVEAQNESYGRIMARAFSLINTKNGSSRGIAGNPEVAFEVISLNDREITARLAPGVATMNVPALDPKSQIDNSRGIRHERHVDADYRYKQPEPERYNSYNSWETW